MTHTVTVPVKGNESSAEREVLGFQLEVLDGPDAGTIWRSSDDDRCRIGSDASCDLVLDDPSVSRFHCDIEILGPHARVRDNQSLNGTLMDRARVVDAYLHNGSILLLGRTELRFQFVEPRPRPLSSRERFGVMVGRSALMRSVFAVLERVADKPITVLLEGESGTGKSAAARSLHLESPRRERPFIHLNCGALPSTLIESELFGHERGAFTGADRARAGAFEDAHRGTLFLDEIGELPMDMQSRLLTVLDTRRVQRVGSREQRPVDVRVIVATNKNLRAEVNSARFRWDLYQRLNVVVVAMPPLRHCLEDIPLLVESALARTAMVASEECVQQVRSPAFMAELQRRSWAGNIRELFHYIDRFLVLDDIWGLYQSMRQRVEEPQREIPDAHPFAIDYALPLAEARREVVSKFERVFIDRLLERHNGNVSRAAASAGVSREYFHKLINKYRIDVERARREPDN